MLGIQLVGVLFGLWMIYYIFIHFKRNEITQTEYTIWFIMWVLFAIVALFPEILSPFVRTLNLNRTMDLLILLGFVFVIGLMFQNHMTIQKTRKRLEELVRKTAVKK
jgi:hypothetical protein